ncbi:hypothetical protein V8C34DRAFT_169900 [Trichoderma compactum]
MTWDDNEMAITRNKGCLLGIVSSVESASIWDDKQEISITLTNESAYSNVKMIVKGKHLKGQWVLQSSAKSILKDDIICLLQGASKLSILRQNEDYFTIVAVAITLTDGTQIEG